MVIPQLPAEMRGNPAAEAAWLEFQRGKFGFLTDPMDALGFFQLFRSLWFVSGLALLVASVCVCTANRLPPIWRNVFSPPDPRPGRILRPRQRGVRLRHSPECRVAGERALDGGATGSPRPSKAMRPTSSPTAYPWAQFATFVSHLALILFLAGGFVTVITAREQQVFIAEGEPALPVFAIDDRDHMQVCCRRRGRALR